ncbi:MAG: response regulator [Proteobacteria bacterium]|nr:response regulator [Pseudomonadota bacterium]MBU1738481.1 response regulator [Pseudomonadota bacterium]
MENIGVLLVDDDPGLREVFADIFAMHREYFLDTAANGAEALEKVRRINFDLALVDISLPDYDGIALTAELKKINPDCVYMIITGHNSTDYVIKAMQVGADDFFMKPIQFEELFIRIRKNIQAKRLALRVKELNRLPKVILDSVNAAICIINTHDLTIASLNKFLLDDLGLSEDEVVGKSCHQLLHHSPVSCKGEKDCPLQKTYTTGEHSQYVHSHTDKSGREYIAEVSASPIFDDTGKVVQVVHVSRDISDRRELEDSLKKEKKNLTLANRELENALHELKSTQGQIVQQEKMASIGSLAAGVAHEINNPMGFIGSNLTTLGKYLGKLKEFIELQAKGVENLPESGLKEEIANQRKKLKIDYLLGDVGDLINESLEGADRVKTIVQNLKSFARVDDVKPAPADVNNCLESTLNIVWNELKYKCTVNKKYGEVPRVMGFPQQLNQVFMNIMVNGAHAIETKGEITIETFTEEDRVKVRITDTGCGIPEKIRGRIFEPFFTTKEVGKGTGLGMSIAYDIVKKHEGEISFETEIGKGTAFTVSLPAVAEEI